MPVRLLQESIMYIHDLCSTIQHENMHNLYWCSLANITSYHSAQLSLSLNNV